MSQKIMTGSETILVVDDEDMILDVAKQMMEKLGYKVYTAGNGTEAIELYKTKRNDIDMVILDMVLPDMEGKEAYECLKKIDPEVMVLLSSGYSIAGEAEEILSRGCNGFIQKPFDLKRLSKKIREILNGEKQGLRQQNMKMTA
ncbi:MAG: response regulator [Deltaproteobacteria bacterium]|nr:response regulator [Deltaproteobacteria bacterium]MBW1961325.1 response regulator [Deltaproteobacteria bacterium]MBW1995118.1 response regulator [Deltaproteobacteria bacterium]MBW2152994.1 response regulator [Deltaproteobacteria bacterium]